LLVQCYGSEGKKASNDVIEDFSINNKLSEEYTYGCTGEGRILFIEKKAASAITLTLLLTSMLTLAFNIQPVKAEPRTWIVDDDGPADFHTIQEAINAANPGDTIYVHNGTYYERILIDKKNNLRLIGESRENTIINSEGGNSVIARVQIKMKWGVMEYGTAHMI
jgi:pectin methylesterase-like acyl-CoA thioesterase